MSSLGALLDAYSLRARGYPTLLLLLPAFVTFGALFPDGWDATTTVVTALMGAAMLYAGSQAVRQVGKRREPGLWRSWGGKPTTVGLRWRTADGPGTNQLLRDRIEKAVPEVTLPTREEERGDQAQADEIYEASVTGLRERTRDTSRFPVVFSENVSYGFRRNAWAVRGVGFAVAFIGLACVAYAVWQDMSRLRNDAGLWIAGGVDLSMAIFWSAVANRKWVRRAAEGYRDALFAAAAAIGD